MTEPHLMNRQNRADNTPLELLLNSNQLLITVALLTPDARHEITLNITNPVSGAPLILSCPPVNNGDSDYLSNNDNKTIDHPKSPFLAFEPSSSPSLSLKSGVSMTSELHSSLETSTNNTSLSPSEIDDIDVSPTVNDLSQSPSDSSTPLPPSSSQSPISTPSQAPQKSTKLEEYLSNLDVNKLIWGILEVK